MNRNQLLNSDKFKVFKRLPSEYNACFYYETDEYYRVYDFDDDEFYSLESLPNKNTFLMQRPYIATDESLLEFANDYLYQILFLKKRIFTKTAIYNKDTQIDLLSIHNGYHHTFYNSIFTVLNLCIRKCHKSKMENLDLCEMKYEDNCFIYGYNNSIPGEYDKLYVYDFKMFYPKIMGDNVNFKIPYKPGKLYKYNEWDVPKTVKDVEFGYYEMDIKLSGKGLTVMKWLPFMNKENYVMTHWDVLIVFKLITIFKLSDDELIMTKRKTKYIYDEDSLFQGSKMFDLWYNVVKSIKDDPHTKGLGKVLSSRAWGVLCASNKKYVKSIDNMKMSDTIKKNHSCLLEVVRNGDGTVKHYSILEKNKPIRKHPYRIKAFITSFGRYMIICSLFNLIVEDCVKIVTDGFYLTKPLTAKFLKSNPTIIYDEEKSNRECKIIKKKVIFYE